MKPFWKDHATPFLLLLVAAFAVFGPSLSHDFLLNWDDPGYVINNEAIKAISWENIKTAFSTFYIGNYAPLQIISYMLDYAVWGDRPAGFIFSNIVFHGASSILFYLLLLRFSIGRTAALGAALLFLVHPVQVESVVWISQRKNVLSMFFYLLSVLMYLYWFNRQGEKWRAAYAVSLAAFVAALLVKSVVVILPLTLFVYAICHSDDRKPGKIIVDKLPYLLAALAIGYLALLTQSAEYHGGGRTGFHGGSPLATIFTMLPVFVSYLRMIVWPSGLSVVYSPEVKTSIDSEVALAAILLALFAWVAYWIYRRNKSLFFWIAAIPIGLLPVSQIVPMVTLMNDRYLYFPMLGVAACVGYFIDYIVRTNQGYRLVTVFIFSCIFALYGFAAQKRAEVWQNSLTLWQDASVKQPKSAVAWLNLGEVYEHNGSYSLAIDSEVRATALCSGVECRLSLRKLSELYLHENNADKAKESINELLRLYPDAEDGYALMGHLYYQIGDLEKAETSYVKALQINPEVRSALIALGNVYLANRRPALAMEKFQTAARIKKPTPELAYSMACAAALMNNRRMALDYLDAALRLGYNNPELIRMNPELGLLKGDRELAMLLERYFPGKNFQ